MFIYVQVHACSTIPAHTYRHHHQHWKRDIEGRMGVPVATVVAGSGRVVVVDVGLMVVASSRRRDHV